MSKIVSMLLLEGLQASVAFHVKHTGNLVPEGYDAGTILYLAFHLYRLGECIAVYTFKLFDGNFVADWFFQTLDLKNITQL